MTENSRSNLATNALRGLANPVKETSLRLALLLATIGLLGAAFLGAVLWETWRWAKEQAVEAADQQARLAVTFDNVLRDYVGTHIRPEVERRAAPDEFVPEAMSTSFVARHVFDGVRREFPDFLLRFPSTNPRNPANAATESEKRIIAFFAEHPQADSWSGTIFHEGAEYYARAVPRRFEPRCLRCHGRPEDAPASMLKRYGSTSGFGSSVGEVSVDLVAIPVSKVLASARAQALQYMIPAVGLCIALLMAIALAVAHDIRRGKRTQVQLAQYVAALQSANEALRESNEFVQTATRAKSAFLANMSHEIRTPMTAILGYADLLDEAVNCCRVCCDHATCKIRAQNRAYVATIGRNGAHLLEILNDVLDLSKIEAGKFEVERQTCSPAAILADAVALMQVRADAKRLPLKLEYLGLIPAAIRSDPLRLRQILINLVGNAIKFTEQGEVRIAVRLENATRRPRLRFEVSDTGIGISVEHIARLFQPFHQGDGSVSRKFGGTGLGLAISKRLAEALGGDIEVQSEPGRGSTFRLTIDPGPLEGVPLVHAAAASPAQPIVAPAAGRVTELHARILLAEDGPDNVRLISLLLKKAGAEVVVAENGHLAVEAALAQCVAGEPFDVILMDMQMPVMDGYAATRTLRAQGYSGPIVALTAHAMVEDRQKCLDAGCDDYTSKPIDRQRLLEVVARWAGQAAVAPASQAATAT